MYMGVCTSFCLSLYVYSSSPIALVCRQDLFKVIAAFLAEQLGDAFTPEAATAWGIVLDTMTKVIKGQLDK